MPRKSATEKPIVVSTGAAAAAPARRRPSTGSKRVSRAAEPSAAPLTVGPTQDEIAKLAYSYWEARGYTGGSPDEDWIRAEQELRAAAE